MEPENGSKAAECQFDDSNLTSAFRLVVESRLELVGETVERVLQSVSKIPGINGNLEEVGLALDEALTNAIIHGNRKDPKKKVEICGGCDHDRNLVLAVTDEGGGFDLTAIPDPTSGDNIFSSRGRGVYLIHQLMDRTEYRKGGRQVVLKKRLPLEGSA